MRQEIMLLSYKQIITIHRFSHYEAKFLLWEIDRERFLTTEASEQRSWRSLNQNGSFSAVLNTLILYSITQ